MIDFCEDRTMLNIIHLCLCLNFVCQLFSSGGVGGILLLRHIKVDGQKRSYRVHLPKGYTGEKKLPLVFVLHGASSNSINIRLVSRMTERANKDQFIVVYPNGSGYFLGCFKTWNAGSCCGPARVRGVDDVSFMRSLIEKMERDYAVDPSRIYVAGMSNGGMMTYRLGAELADKIAAIACVEGTMVCKKLPGTEPVSVVVLHSRQDRVVPIEGGTGKWLTHRFKCRPAQEAIDYWVERNQCSSKPEINVKDGLVVKKYRGGRNGTEVVFYGIEDGGHSWPGAISIPFVYRTSRKISATDTICQFFFEHSKQLADRSGAVTAP